MKIIHHHEHHHRLDPQVEARLRAIECQLDLILTYQETLMATKQEVADDIAEIKREVAETRGAANSALELLKKTLARIEESLTTSADLDAFRADFALIKGELAATEADLKAAVEQNPSAPVPPTP